MGTLYHKGPIRDTDFLASDWSGWRSAFETAIDPVRSLTISEPKADFDGSQSENHAVTAFNR